MRHNTFPNAAFFAIAATEPKPHGGFRLSGLAGFKVKHCGLAAYEATSFLMVEKILQVTNGF